MKLFLDLDGTIVSRKGKTLSFIDKNIKTIKQKIEGKNVDEIKIISMSVVDKKDEAWFNCELRGAIQKIFGIKTSAVVLEELWDKTGMSWMEGKKDYFIGEAKRTNAQSFMVFDDSFYKDEVVKINDKVIELNMIGLRYENWK